MQIDVDTIVNLLRAEGRGDDAVRARSELPALVDLDRDAPLLARFGLDPARLLTDAKNLLGR